MSLRHDVVSWPHRQSVWQSLAAFFVVWMNYYSFTWQYSLLQHGCDHYSDVIMGTVASQITSLTIVNSTVHSGADKRKRQSSASLDFVRGIHRWPVNSPHKGPVTRKMFPFDDIIMNTAHPPIIRPSTPAYNKHCISRRARTLCSWVQSMFHFIHQRRAGSSINNTYVIFTCTCTEVIYTFTLKNTNKNDDKYTLDTRVIRYGRLYKQHLNNTFWIV